MAVDIGGALGGEELARLGVVVQADGVEQTVAEFDQMAAAGERAAQRMGAAGSSGASSLERAYTDSISRTRQVVETQLNALTQLTAGAGPASPQSADIAGGLAQGLRAQADAGRLTAAQMAQLSDAERALAGASKAASDAAAAETAVYERRAVVLAQLKGIDENAARNGAALGTVTRASAAAVEGELPLYERRAVVLAHMAALEQDAARAIEVESIASKGAAASALLHGAGVGRMAQEAGTAAGRMLGLNTVLTRLAASVGGNVIGFLPMIAALGGITLAATAVEKVYAALTEETRKAKEEQDRLTEALDAWYKEQQQGPAGELPAQIDAMIAKIRELKAELANENGVANAPFLVKLKGVLLADAASLLPTADLTTASRVYRETIKRYYEDIGKESEQDATKVAAEIKAANEKVAAAIKDAARAEIDALATAVSSGQATGGETKLAQNLLADYQRQLAHLQQIQPPASSGQAFRDNLAQQADLLGKVTTLTGAFTAAERTGTEALKQRLDALEHDNAATVRATDEYTKQAEAAAKVTADTRASFAAIQDKIALVSAEGLEHDRLANHLEYEAQRRALVTQIIAAGNAAEAQALTLRYTESQQLEQLADKYIVLARAADYARKIQEDLANTRAKVATLPGEVRDATTGLTRITFDYAYKVEKPDTSAAEQAMKNLSRGIFNDLSSAISGALDHGLGSFRDFATNVTHLIDDLAARIIASKLQDALTAPKGSAAASQSLGQQFSSLPAAGQFAIAYEGINLLATGLNKLIGASGPPSRQQLEQWANSFVALNQAISDYAAIDRSSADQALADNKAKADALRAQTEQVLAGKKLEQERERQLAAINAAEDARNKKIAGDLSTSLVQQLNALNGPAGAYANSLAAIQQQYADNVAGAQAVFNSTHDLAALMKELAGAEAIRAKAETQLRAAEADRVDQLQASLDAREAAAKGLDVEAAVIARRAAERHQLFEDEQHGYTDAQLAQEQYIQGLEDERAAKERLATATAAYNDAVNAGPQGSLATKSASDAQALNDKLANDTAAYNAALDRLNADILNGADAATIAADQTDVLAASTTVAGDNAAIAAQKFQAAAAQMQQAATQVEKDVQLGFTTPTQGLAYEAAAFGFTGLTTDQIRALYTPFSGTPLTNEQLQQNQNVETYLSDLQKWTGQVTDTLSAVGQAQVSTPATTALVNAAQSLTEQTGTRLADTTTSIALDVHRLRELAESGGAVYHGSLEQLQPLTPNAANTAPRLPLDTASLSRFGAPIPFFNPQPILPPATTDDIVAQLETMLRTAPAARPVSAPAAAGVGTLTINVSNTITIGARESETDDAFIQRIGTEVARRSSAEIAAAVEQIFGRQYVAQLLRDGNPVKPY